MNMRDTGYTLGKYAIFSNVCAIPYEERVPSGAYLFAAGGEHVDINFDRQTFSIKLNSTQIVQERPDSLSPVSLRHLRVIADHEQKILSVIVDKEFSMLKD